jgi:steroid delta-isomerase-like uncharacterized protein
MPSATTYDLKALSRRWFEEVWNKGRAEAIEEMLHPQGIPHGIGDTSEGRRGPAAFMPFYQAFRRAFPDMRIVVEDVLAEGDQTAIRFSFTGTHSGPGPMKNLAATGRPFRATGLTIVRWQDGQIIEAWNEFDAAGMMAQLGA